MVKLNLQKLVRIVLKMLKFVKKFPAEMERLRLKLENNAIMKRTMEKMGNVLFLVPFSIRSNPFAGMGKLTKEKPVKIALRISKISV